MSTRPHRPPRRPLAADADDDPIADTCALAGCSCCRADLEDADCGRRPPSPNAALPRPPRPGYPLSPP